MRFRDRSDAGTGLADRHATEGLHDTVVLALPRGGMPVASEVAMRLDAPLEVFVARKIGAPGQPELRGPSSRAAPPSSRGTSLTRYASPTSGCGSWSHASSKSSSGASRTTAATLSCRTYVNAMSSSSATACPPV